MDLRSIGVPVRLKGAKGLPQARAAVLPELREPGALPGRESALEMHPRAIVYEKQGVKNNERPNVRKCVFTI